MASAGEFVLFQRSDGSRVACQLSRILFVAKGDHGSVLHFGGGTQLNIRDDFDEVLGRLGISGTSPTS